MDTQTPAKAESPLQKAVAALRARKDKLALLKADFDKAEGAIKAEIEMIERGLLNHLSDMGVDSVRVGDQLVYTLVERKPIVQDWAAFGGFILEQGDIGYLQKRAAKGAVDDYVAEHGSAPPGVDFHAEKVIRLRKS